MQVTMPPSLESCSRKIATECLVSRVRVLNRAITRIYDEAMRGQGVTVAQLNTLIVINEMGEARPSDVAAALDVDLSTLTRNLRRMVEHGWLKAVASDDGRSQPLQLTARGRSLIEKLFPLWSKAQEQVVNLLGESFTKAVFRAAARFSQLPS